MDNFAGGAARLAGFAGALLGWRPGEFWEATPVELETIARAMRGDAGEDFTSDEFAALRTQFPDGG